MTLKEKFKEVASIDNGLTLQEVSEQCEKISEEFAIGFAEWCLDENHIILNDGKELLEIYKKEKRL